jgi:hypothetical protein
MYCDICLRKGTVYIPTMGKMGEGFYRGVDPVAVVAVSNTEALREALNAAIVRGNPIVPILRRSEWTQPVVLKYAGVKNWSTFERGMQLWEIDEKEGTTEIAEKKKQSDRMWRRAPDRTVTFPPGTPINNVIERMIAILQDAAK